MQEHYYAEPPQIERGWRHYLMSTAGPVLPRHGQQRHGARPRPSAGRRDRGPAAAQAEHQLAVQLRGGGRVQRATRRHAARTAGHRVPGQFRFGGKRSGAAAGDGGDRHDATSSRSARHTTGGRMPPMPCRRRSPTTRMRLPPGPIGCIRWSRPTASAASTAAPTPAGTRPRRSPRSSSWSPTAARPRRSSAKPVYGNAGGMALPDGYLRAGVRRGARGAAAWRSPTRCRSATAGSANGSGVSSSRTWCPTSCRSRSRRATAIRSARSSPAARSPTAFQLAGLLLLLHRRQPAVVRDRHHRARRAARRRAAAQRRARGRPPEGASCRRCSDKHPIIGTVHGIGLYLASRWSATADTLEPADRGDRGDLRPDARARRGHPADRRSA